MAETVFLIIRTTKDEKKQWKDKAEDAGLSLSDLFRKTINQSRTSKQKLEQKRIIELARISNNLNLIARWCNLHQYPIDAIQIIKQLIIIERHLQRIE